MIYDSKTLELDAVLATARRMCAVARTAPKARGIDTLLTMVLTGREKDELAEQMEALAQTQPQLGFFMRDADGVRAAQAVVLLGVGKEKNYRGVPACGYCGFADCAACAAAGGRCAMAAIDLGVALGAACAAAAEQGVDNRLMFSIGRAAAEIPCGRAGMMWVGIPLSVSGKNIFFDRK